MNAKTMVRMACVAVLGMMWTTMAHAEWKWSGYTQLRYNIWDSEYGSKKPDSDFLVRRARVKLVGTVTEDTTLTLQADLSNLVNEESTSGKGDVELKDALLTRKISPEWSITGGFGVIPFGYEVPTSDAVQLPLERSQAASKFFPGERDLGLYAHYKPALPHYPEFSIGYSNGVDRWYDTSSAGNRDDASKALVARAQWSFLQNGLAGISYMTASRDRGPAGGPATSFDNQDVLGLHARYVFPSKVLLQGEYYDGKYLNEMSEKDAKGWYGMVGYTFSKLPVTGYYRYDTLDSGDPQDFKRNIFGVAYDRSKSERFTLQFENIDDDGKGASFDNWSAQWMVKY